LEPREVEQFERPDGVFRDAGREFQPARAEHPHHPFPRRQPEQVPISPSLSVNSNFWGFVLQIDVYGVI
jgi:hypothetical protein